MTKISLVTPSVGELNTAAEPKVTTALKEVEKFLNEQKIESTDNIKPEGIKEASLEKALQEKFTVRLGFTVEKQNASFEAVNEKYYLMEKAGSTCTLPKPTANRIIAMYAATATAVKVTASEGKIIGDYFEGTTCELAPNQHLAVIAEGFNWRIFAGEPKREGKYEAEKTLTTVEMEAGVEFSATRPAYVIPAGELTGLEIGGIKIAESKLPFLIFPGQKAKATKGQKVSVLLL